MTGRKSGSALLACTAMALLFAANVTAAQEAGQADGTVLNRIVVKGKRVPAGTASDTPLASSTSAETLRENEVDSIKDLGNSTEPGVDFINSRPGRTGGLFIRGLGQSRVLTLVDGIPIPYFENFARAAQTTSTMSDANSSFDFSSLSAVDVVRGADSSRLGSGALGGALVLRTLEPEDLIGEGRDWGGVAKLTYDGEDKAFGGAVGVAKKIDNTSLLFQGAYKRGHEQRTKGTSDVLGPTRTKANPADYDQNNLLFKVRHDIEGGHRIGLTLERYEQDTDSDLRTLQTTYRPGYAGWDDTLRERVSLDYTYEAPSEDSFIDAARLTGYWQRLSKEAGSDGFRISDGAVYAREETYRQGAFGLTGGIISGFETGTLDHTVRFGGNYENFDFKEYIHALTGTSTSGSSADMPRVDGNRLGLYLEDEIAFGDSGFSLTPGVRFDWFDYDPSGSVATNTGYATFGLPGGHDGSRFSPKIMASYQVTPELGVFAQWSTAYRAPTMNELYLNFTNAVGGYAVTGNTALVPETSNGFEIGAKYETNDLNGSLTLFHNKYRNFIEQYTTTTSQLIVRGQPGMLFTYRNRAHVEISGVEAKVRKEFANGFFAHASLAYAYGKDKDSGQFLRTVAPFKSIIGIGYEQEHWGVDLTGVFASGMRDDKVATTFDAPGYGVANLTGWWEPEQVKGMRIQAGVYNIFDRTYYNAVGVRDINPNSTSGNNQPLPFYSEAGRSFKISLTQKF